ncbi:Zn(2)-C6 fungal-type DNA-binding domain [Phaffia rhodozyma]|uniref:Zn(2)-C6 fungal-type DNA-binding domain n=1 Tax=Phaffia rhodozyma TaxID=264483 RepID=A0A0F7SK83_PHARH|nr:Zn(2)-C6 fungal-type DNA-binding domain [Phaffia rhodozyma]
MDASVLVSLSPSKKRKLIASPQLATIDALPALSVNTSPFPSSNKQKPVISPSVLTPVLTGPGSPPSESSAEKRTKTSRACDKCRSSKTRCDILPNSEPPVCKHCLNAQVECTFFLPITETRFKKKRGSESAAAVAASTSSAASQVLSRERKSSLATPDTSGEDLPTRSPPTDDRWPGNQQQQQHRSGSSSASSIAPSASTSAIVTHGRAGSSTTSSFPPSASGISNLAFSAVPNQPHYAPASHPYSIHPSPKPSSFPDQHPFSAASPYASQTYSPYQLSVSAPNNLSPANPSPSIPNPPKIVPRSSNEGPRLARVQGPTSVPFLLHSSASLPAGSFSEYDLKHHTFYEIGAEGDGLIKVYDPSSEENGDHLAGLAGKQPCSRFGDNGGASKLTPAVFESLLNIYFTTISPLFPVITKHEFLDLPSPPPLLLYAICGVAATRRDIPREIFQELRKIINGIIKKNDVLSEISLVNVQSLLVLSTVGDLHKVEVNLGGAVANIRLGVAVRMAQELGLHRDEIKKTDHLSDQARLEERAFLELKRRVWSCCVIMDRWYAASLGVPILIDLHDCDVLLPDPFEVPLPDRISDPACQGAPYLFLSEFLKLSILLGKVTKTIYGPMGLAHTNDQQLNDLLRELRFWRSSLAPALQFQGPHTGLQAGLLQVFYTAILFLFWRVHQRISYEGPRHLTFCLDISSWTECFSLSKEAIFWLDANDSALDTFFVTSYSATSIALIQYHTWARRKDPAALEALKTLSGTCRRWETAVQPEHMSIRRRTVEVMSLLYNAALHAHSPHARGRGSFGNHGQHPHQANNKRLNPTHGVRNNRPDLHEAVSFKADRSLPGGGVFMAADALKKQLDESGVLQGTIEPSDRPSPAGGSRSESVRISGQEQEPNGVDFGVLGTGSGWNFNPDIKTGNLVGFVPPMPTPGLPSLTIENGMVSGSSSGSGQSPDSGLGMGSGTNMEMRLGQAHRTGSGEAESGLQGTPSSNWSDEFLVSGVPNQMFDWPSWDSFFSQFSAETAQSASPLTNVPNSF